MAELLSILLIFLFGFYILFVFQSEQLSLYFARFLKRNKIFRASYSTLWIELDYIKRNRRFVIVLLLLLLISTLAAIVSVIPTVTHATNLSSGSVWVILFFLSFVPIGVFLIEQVKNYGVGSFNIVRHGKESDVSSISQSLSIATGLGLLEHRIIAHVAPTIFTSAPFGAKPTVYITSAFLNLADHSELEAALAHEYSQVVSGRLHDHKFIDILTISLQASLFVLFMFLIVSISPIELAAVFGSMSLAFFMPSSYKGYTELEKKPEFPVEKILELLVPPFAFVRFVSNTVLYYLSSDENYWADLYAVYITRTPRPLYSVLQKLRDYGALPNLPLDFASAYITHNFVSFGENINPFPTIDDRLHNLSLIDSSLSAGTVLLVDHSLVCPLCRANMKEIEGKSLYGATVVVDLCMRCGSVWYDNMELFLASDIGAFDMPKVTMTTKDGYECPNCRISLSAQSREDFPENLVVWHCSSCNGNFLEHVNVKRFMAYRTTQIARMGAKNSSVRF